MDFVVNLDYNQSTPLYQRLAEQLITAIRDGRLKCGESMPSVRDLSLLLGISRSTVLKAFAHLREQGYIESLSGAGSFVCAVVERGIARAQSDVDSCAYQNFAATDYAKRVLELEERQVSSCEPAEINYHGPPLDLAPVSQWSRLLQRHAQSADLERLSGDGGAFGYLPLRQAVAAYLHRSRGVRSDEERVAICGTKHLALDIVCRLLLDAGDSVAFEEPGFPEARKQFITHGASVIPIPVDRDGLDVSFLESSPHKFKLVYVTPSHQDPTGAVLSLERRKRLLEWAAKTGAFIIEDDYDCEFKYGRKSLPSIQSMDEHDCVIYLGSLWKVLFQVLRLAYAVVPECLQRGFLLVKQGMEPSVPVLEQLALTDFVNDGVLERHIKRSHAIYQRRRQALLFSLTRFLGPKAVIARDTGGMHVIVQIQTELPDDVVLACARSAQLPMISTAEYYADEQRQGEFMVGFAHIDPLRVAGQLEWFADVMLEKERLL